MQNPHKDLTIKQAGLSEYCSYVNSLLSKAEIFRIPTTFNGNSVSNQEALPQNTQIPGLDQDSRRFN